MAARSLLISQFARYPTLVNVTRCGVRCLTTSSPSPSTAPPTSPQHKNWLTRWVESSPTAMKVFLGYTNALGYGSPKQLAARRAFVLYEKVCAVRPDDEREFWQRDCHLPPTFQSWFTVTNLHIWLLTVRLRALPKPHGKFYLQALIDHFFLDVEDRIQAVLQPPSTPQQPYTFDSPFYINPSAPSDVVSQDGRPRKRSKAPDRVVTRQMKIFKEQWAGMGLSLDLALVKGDMEMAAVMWRNILGARGAQGIAFPEADLASTPARKFRRAVNLVGGEVINVAKINVDQEEARDDGSGVHDFTPEESDLYLQYPQVMLDLVTYARRELARLDSLSDKQIMSGPFDRIKFGHVKEP